MQVNIKDILSQGFLKPLECLASLTHGYAGSDIRDVVHHGTPQDDANSKITLDTLLTGLSKVWPRKGFSIPELPWTLSVPHLGHSTFIVKMVGIVSALMKCLRHFSVGQQLMSVA